MPRKGGANNAHDGGHGGGEIQVSKSPAEFFAENQAIAGFDNMGKSLYTSIRELIENSLDACESIGTLPHIVVSVEELTESEFNHIRGISVETKDIELFRTKKKKDVGSLSSSNKSTKSNTNKDSSAKTTKQGKKNGPDEQATPPTTKPTRKRVSQEGYFRIKVKDNGCGMKHEKIPDLLGRVLSGSKYGVRQTRGKFGLGAKMALIWSKKSTGVPIKITTAHRPKGGLPSSHLSTCTLDIDITHNCPRVIHHKKQSNAERKYVGTELEILIAGNWTTYKSRILQYLQQLAIITPYAQLELSYQNISEPQRNIKIRYDRRSEQMPKPAREVKHHPSSVNNLVIQQLIERSRYKSVSKFLEKELSSVSSNVAKRIVTECGWDDDEMEPSDLTDRHVTKLVQVLRTVQMFKAPDGSCLSPLGEYNLNLGIRKVLEPEYVATARDRPCAYEGHPFLVEAAVSLGGKDVKEGISVVRFANRIPLLFEAGADVSTRVAQTKIKWSNYKMDHKRDRIGVFVSIVSTKIPYKGTGKEYIGDDITAISISVKRALQTCCQQLRTHLQKRNALRDQKERKSRLCKYIPDVTRSLYGLLDGMKKRRFGDDDDDGRNGGPNRQPEQIESPRKRPKKQVQPMTHGIMEDLIKRFDDGELNESIIQQRLEDAVNLQHDDIVQENEGHKNKNDGTDINSKDEIGIPLYLKPQFGIIPNQQQLINRSNDEDEKDDVDEKNKAKEIPEQQQPGDNVSSFFPLKNETPTIIDHPLFIFRPMEGMIIT